MRAVIAERPVAAEGDDDARCPVAWVKPASLWLPLPALPEWNAATVLDSSERKKFLDFFSRDLSRGVALCSVSRCILLWGFPQSGECKDFTFANLEAVRLLDRSHFCPLVEPICRNGATFS